MTPTEKPLTLPTATRVDLARWLKDWGAIRGAEIGVLAAEYSEVLLREGLELICVDAWKTYRGYPDYRRQTSLDKARALAMQRLAPYRGHCSVIEAFSVDAAKEIADLSLDFVYIDGNHDYQHVTEDITVWSKKVKPGGIISGHDYSTFQPDVMRATGDYVKAHGIRLWFLLGSSDSEQECSWFWVKE